MQFKINDAYQLLPAAYKIRNAPLFRECVVRIAGDCESSDLKPWDMNVPTCLYAVIEKAIHGIDSRLARTQRRVFEILNYHSDLKTAIYCAVFSETDGLPEYYRKIGDIITEKVHLHEVSDTLDAIRDLLKVNLAFCDKDLIRAHSDFYCAEVLDEDLPWDVTQTDW